MIEAFAGTGFQAFSGDGGPAIQAAFWDAAGIAVGVDGSLYVSDSSNNRVRRIGIDGIINTVAGNGDAGFSGDGGPALQAGIWHPTDVAVGPDGTLYILETTGRVRRVIPDGIITTVAGDGGAYSGDGGPAAQAGLGDATSIAAGPDGSLYIAGRTTSATNVPGYVRRVGPDGIITLVAGTPTAPDSDYLPALGDGGPANQAQLLGPHGIAVGPDGSIYIADVDDVRVRRVGPDGIIRHFAGTEFIPPSNSNGDGGPAAEAFLDFPFAVAVGPDGRVYIGEGASQWAPCRVRVVGSDGIINTLAGNGTIEDSGDGGAAAAADVRFLSVNGHQIAIGADGSVYLSTTANRIRRVVPHLPGFSAANQIVIPDESGTELFVFDSLGKHLQTLDALTGTARYQFDYNSAGLLVTVTDGDNNTTTIERDGNGNPTAIVGPYGARTPLTLDPNGYLASVTNPAGESVAMTYSPDGLLATLTDARQHLHQFTYDGLGRLIHDVDPADGFTHLDRTELADGHEVTSATAMNRVSKYRVEELPTGQQRRVNTGTDNSQTVAVIGTDGLTTTTSADNTVTSLLEGPDPRWGMQTPLSKTSTTRTPSGLESTVTTARAVTLSDPTNPLSLVSQTDTVTVNGRTYTTVYAAATRTFTTTSPEGRQDSTVLDALGRVTQSQVAGLDPVNFAYDPRGRLDSIRQGSGVNERPTVFSYKPNGYLDTVTDSLNRVVRFDYDNAGRVTSQTLPDNRVIFYSYDGNGNLTSVTPPSRPAHGFDYTPVDLVSNYTPPDVGAGANATTYQYNLDRQPTLITRPDGQTIGFGYDTAGRLSTITTPTGQSVYAYNEAGCNCSGVGQLSSITAPDVSLSYGYDGSLPLNTSWTGAINASVSRTFDSNFRMVSESVNGGSTIGFSYDNDGLLTGAGDLTLTRNPQNGELTGTTLGSVGDSRPYNTFGEPIGYEATVSGSPFYSVTYTRDKLGRITDKSETVSSATDAYHYSYDGAGRLTEVHRNGTLVSQYEYDGNSNRTVFRQPVSGTELSATYDNQDRLLTHGPNSYSYTDNGELLSRTGTIGTTTFSYDVLGNLRAVTLPDTTDIEYLIDGQNRRVAKKVNGVLAKGFVYGGHLQIVAELDGNANLVSRFVYGDRANVPSYLIKGGITYRIISDQLGSPRLIVNTSDGSVAQRIDYDEFGNVTADTSPGFQPFGFAGGLYDPHTRLVRFGVRDYDPETGRWTSKDLILFSAGDANLYGYVINNPINWIDPWGLHSLTYQGGNLTYYDDNGNPVGTYPATSGRPGQTDPGKPGKGPIPPGTYTLYPSEISEGGFFRNLLGDWGRYRVPLHPNEGTNTYGRKDFFLHGGKTPGSAGCIDVGDKDKDLFPQLQKHLGTIPVTVK